MSRLPVSDIILSNPTYEELKKTPIGEWFKVFVPEQFFAYLHIRGKDCILCLEPCSDYCNRGSWLAKVDVLDEVELTVDWADGWSPGRYYFDKERAMLECEAWLRARKQIDGGDRP